MTEELLQSENMCTYDATAIDQWVYDRRLGPHLIFRPDPDLPVTFIAKDEDITIDLLDTYLADSQANFYLDRSN